MCCRDEEEGHCWNDEGILADIRFSVVSAVGFFLHDKLLLIILHTFCPFHSDYQLKSIIIINFIIIKLINFFYIN